MPNLAKDPTVYVSKAKLGDLVKLKKPETSYTLSDGLKDGDEAIVTGEWDHSYYRVTKDGREFDVSFMCIDLPLVSYPRRPGHPPAL